MINENVLNPIQASEYVGFSANTLKVWRCQNKKPAYFKIGRSVRYRRSDLDSFLSGDVEQEEKAVVSVKKEMSAQKKEADYFNEFWDTYDNKKDRKKCLAIWKRKKLDKIGLDIIAKVAYQHENDPQWPKYQPNPSTYLNGDRWEDEIREAKECEETDVDKMVENLKKRRANGDNGFFSQAPEKEIIGERL